MKISVFRALRCFIALLTAVSLAVSLSLTSFCAFSEKTHKKAIYVLPGFCGSRLYDKNGGDFFSSSEIIKADIAKYILSGGEASALISDESGINNSLHADREKDSYGNFDSYFELVDALSNTLGEEYDVVFFSCNWLSDISVTAKELENDINQKGYESVVFVAHSEGGLLYSAYVAGNEKNKAKVEKAILCGVPLYGTYAALTPLEQGDSNLFDALSNVKALSTVSGIAATVARWVRAVCINSPAIYQLLPDENYLKLMPAKKSENGDLTDIERAEDFYSVLCGSANVNGALVSQGKNSANYFRNVFLSGNLAEAIKGPKTVIVGTRLINELIPSTPSSCTYDISADKSEISDFTYSSLGDGTVMGISAFAVDENGYAAFDYKDFSDINCSHGALTRDARPIEFICDYISDSVEPTSKNVPIYPVKRYIGGYSDNSFCPDKPITRLETLNALNALLELPRPVEKASFIDLDEENSDTVSRFCEAGIIGGYEDGTIRLENPITRAELLKILTIAYNTETKADYPQEFSDTNNHWARAYIENFASNGYVKGYPDNSFRPDNKVTRAEAVTIINRVEGLYAFSAAKQYFTDLDSSHWAFESIMCCAKTE